MNPNPLPLPPGRAIYEQARRLQRAKRRRWLNRVTVVQRDAKVIPFPTKEAD